MFSIISAYRFILLLDVGGKKAETTLQDYIDLIALIKTLGGDPPTLLDFFSFTNKRGKTLDFRRKVSNGANPSFH